MFRIELGDDVVMSQFHDLLKRNLSFDNIATTVDVDDVSVPFAHFFEYKKIVKMFVYFDVYRSSNFHYLKT